MHESWRDVLGEEFSADYFKELAAFVRKEREEHAIYPQAYHVFKAFSLTSLDDVKVVILGQDPYIHEGQAHGLAFSVPPGQRVPPSLRNIYKELETDVEGFRRPSHGCLTPWAKQGVFLLNTALTVRSGQPGSHRDQGWERFTDRVIQVINNLERRRIVFLLWGRQAAEKAMFIDASRHVVFQAAHPSPMSASKGFFGCRHFSKANVALVESGQNPVDWKL